MRKRIDEIDDHILALLKDRAEVCRTIGAIKKQVGDPLRDGVRETELRTRMRNEATRLGLNPDHVEEIYRRIITMCTLIQETHSET
jgi:chorismate mutase